MNQELVGVTKVLISFVRLSRGDEGRTKCHCEARSDGAISMI